MKHESIPPPPASPDSGPPQATEPRWTTRKMTEFLRALAAMHSVKDAAKAVGMSRQSAYKLRSRLKGLAFDAAWDEVFKHSYENLPYAALERALNGIEVPHYYKGELIGTSRRYDERLTVALLKMISSAPCLILGSEVPGMHERGRRFEARVRSRMLGRLPFGALELHERCRRMPSCCQSSKAAACASTASTRPSRRW